MDINEDADEMKRDFADKENADLKRPIDMTVPERIGMKKYRKIQ